MESRQVHLAAGQAQSPIIGFCTVDMKLHKSDYRKIRLGVLKSLCSDIILGVDFLSVHKRLEFKFDGSKPPLVIDKTTANPACNLATVSISPPSLFSNLTKDCKPIATKSRQYSKEDRAFIKLEVSRLLKEGIAEPSTSAWRSQVVVCENENGKKRLAIDYSQTINKFTLLDAYPFPNKAEQVNQISQYKYYSHLDLRSAYHQIPIKEEERHFTAFEANGALYQFTRMPFGVTNGVSKFQRFVDDFIKDYNLKDTFALLDNVTICGNTLQEHDQNLNAFMKAAKQMNFTFNEDKSVIRVQEIDILGYRISQRSLKPDPERMAPLRNLPIPSNDKELKRCIGILDYYSTWIPLWKLIVLMLLKQIWRKPLFKVLMKICPLRLKRMLPTLQ